MKKTDHVKVPVLNLRMMSNEEELAAIEECERKILNFIHLSIWQNVENWQKYLVTFPV